PGPFCALEVGTLIPVDTKPLEPLENDLGVRVGAPLLVGVLDAEHEGAAGLPGIEPVEERRPGAPDVKVAGGRWGEANANWSGCHGGAKHSFGLPRSNRAWPAGRTGASAEEPGPAPQAPIRKAGS